jgi:hypothetical protein
VTGEDRDQPITGVFNGFKEIIPGHIHLRDLAQEVKAGIFQACGIPMEFPIIGVCDGLVMGHELTSAIAGMDTGKKLCSSQMVVFQGEPRGLHLDISLQRLRLEVP